MSDQTETKIVGTVLRYFLERTESSRTIQLETDSGVERITIGICDHHKFPDIGDKIRVVGVYRDDVFNTITWDFWTETTPETQTFHIGLSVYELGGATGEFIGAITIDHHPRYSNHYDSFEDAKLCTLKTLAELVVVDSH